MNISKHPMSKLIQLTSLLSVLIFIYHNINTENLIAKKTNISTIYNLEPFERELKNLDLDSLVVFDISKVIFIKGDAWERGYKNERWASNTFNSLYKKGSKLFQTVDPKIKEELRVIRNSVNDEILIDKAVNNIIKTLQEQSVKTIALTRCLVEKIGETSSEQVRINKLLAHGIDFSRSFPYSDKIEFKQFSYENKSPIFKQGVLFTSHAVSKGKLLKAFFEKINWYPKKVIMIDDGIANLKSVQEELNTLGIEFIGFEYKAYERFPAFFDKEIAEFQMKYLFDNKMWLSAQEAAKHLNKTLILSA